MLLKVVWRRWMPMREVLKQQRANAVKEDAQNICQLCFICGVFTWINNIMVEAI